MNDAELVNQVLNGNENAFRFLVAKHQRLVMHVVGRIVQRQEDVEDVCQEVFIKVFRQLKRFRGDSRLSTWIATIAYNTGISHIRKQIRQNEHSYDEQPALIMSEKDDSPNQKIVEKEEVKKPLIITSAHASCGCTVPEFSKEPLAPGQNGYIKVLFDTSGRSGMQSKSITIESNASNNIVILRIKAEIVNE